MDSSSSLSSSSSSSLWPLPPRRRCRRTTFLGSFRSWTEFVALVIFSIVCSIGIGIGIEIEAFVVPEAKKVVLRRPIPSWSQSLTQVAAAAAATTAASVAPPLEQPKFNGQSKDGPGGPSPIQPYTVQILMSDTGGGHRASAVALSDALEVLYPGQFECDIVDIYTDYGPFWPFNWYVPAYKIMAEYSFLWAAFYDFGCTEFGLWFNNLLLDTFCFEPFRQCLERPSGSSGKRADMVVSVHPLTQDLPLKILRVLDNEEKGKDGKKRKTPFATVVTDLGSAHPTWFHPGVDQCFVPSDVLQKRALERGVPSSRIVQHGLPVRRGFWSSSSSSKDNDTEDVNDNNNNRRVALRQSLGLDPSLPTALVVGGGDGMGGIAKVAEALGETLENKKTAHNRPDRNHNNDDGDGDDDDTFQIVVVCGKNQEARQQLERRFGSSSSSQSSTNNNARVQVHGFVSNMDEWMAASDVLVTKAGPGTIAEACICGLPCVLSSFLPGQEAGNVPYVQDGGFGTYSDDPSTIASLVSEWLSSTHADDLADRKRAALRMARPSATLDIAKDLASLVMPIPAMSSRGGTTKGQSSERERV